jgi:hypothetical protein
MKYFYMQLFLFFYMEAEIKPTISNILDKLLTTE